MIAKNNENLDDGENSKLFFASVNMSHSEKHHDDSMEQEYN